MSIDEIYTNIIALSSTVAVDADESASAEASLIVIDQYKSGRLDQKICEADVLVMLMAAATIASMLKEIESLKSTTQYNPIQ